MLFKSVNGSYKHGTMEKHCLLACLLIVREQSDDEIVLCRHVCVCVFMYKVYVCAIFYRKSCKCVGLREACVSLLARGCLHEFACANLPARADLKA